METQAWCTFNTCGTYGVNSWDFIGNIHAMDGKAKLTNLL